MPILIAHRGNLVGPSLEYENNPNYIHEGLSKDSRLCCEVDVWYKDGEWYLGHYFPAHKINYNFLTNSRLWCHAKNLSALVSMLKNPVIHCFWHQEDNFTLTSRGFIWTYPDKELASLSICVMPELWFTKPDISVCAGICSDFISEYLLCG